MKTIKLITFFLFFTLSTNAQTGCWSKVSIGTYFTIAIQSDGTMWGWGVNNYGQIGNGTFIDSAIPVQIGTSNDWAKVDTRGSHAMAIKNDGTLWSWGWSPYGQLGVGNLITYNTPQQVGTSDDWKEVSASFYHTMAVKVDGTLWGWGNSENFAVFLNPLVVVPVQIGSATDWKHVAAGGYFNVAVKNNGTLWHWGSFGLGNDVLQPEPVQLGIATDWDSISASYFHVSAVKLNGTLWTWGVNNYGQLGLGFISSNNFPLLTPIQVGVANNWLMAAAGGSTSMAVKTDNTLWAWGINSVGQFGNGTITNSSIPIQVGTNWELVNTNYGTTAGVKSDGTLWTFGQNTYGQLGNGTLIAQNIPGEVLCTNLNIEKFNTKSLTIYPNPADNILFINKSVDDTIVNVTIYNILGKKLMTINDNISSINVSQLPRDLYIIKIQTKDSVQQYKFIKN